VPESTQVNEVPEASQGEETPRGLPVYVDSTEPEIQDPAEQRSPSAWAGSNAISFKLLRCMEAIRDLTRMLRTMATLQDPLSERRGVKILATPLYSLASGVRDVFHELEGNAKAYARLLPSQHKELRERARRFTREVPLHKTSALRAVRDKIGAHIDRDAVLSPDKYWGRVDLPAYLRWVRACSEETMYLLNLDIYAWTRESGHPDVSSLMTVDGTVVDLYIQDGKPVSPLSITLARSPKYGIANEIGTLVSMCDDVAAKCEHVDGLAPEQSHELENKIDGRDD